MIAVIKLAPAMEDWIEETLNESIDTLYQKYDPCELPALAQEALLQEQIHRYEGLKESGMVGAELKRSEAERARASLSVHAKQKRRAFWSAILIGEPR